MTLIVSYLVIADIVWNVEQMTEAEQQQVLTRLKIERILSKKKKPIVRAKEIMEKVAHTTKRGLQMQGFRASQTHLCKLEVLPIAVRIE